MIENKKIPKQISQWQIDYDPYGFTVNEKWLETAEKTEDILQLTQLKEGGLTLDVGYYTDSYKVYVISNADWENPIEELESKDAELISETLYSYIEKYT